MAEPRSWTLTVHPPGGRVWGSNADSRAHRLEVARHRKGVREQAGWLARAARIPPLRRARVAATVHLRLWMQADPGNFPGGATLKAAIDGLVDAGVIPDDTQTHLDLAMPVLAPPDGDRPRVVLTITEALDGAR